ncbi:hypothetical protein ACKWTF_008790 [Chironomus riparius]
MERRKKFRKRQTILLFLFILILALTISFFILSHFVFNCELKIVFAENFNEIEPEFLTNGTIYFMETHNSIDHQITAREACAIESAAFMNPDEKIVVLFLTPDDHIRLKSWDDFKPILSYKNVHLKYITMKEFTKDTKIEKWLKTEALKSSKYIVSHTSDILRYVLLYKYSGVYLDLDVITVDSLKNLDLPNYACYHVDGGVINSGIMKLSGKEGKKFADMMINEIVDNYDGSEYNNLGPAVITKTVKKYCDVQNLTDFYGCKDFKVLHQSSCYAVGWDEWFKLFKEQYADEAMQKIKKSFFVHLWNSTNKGRTISKFNDAALNRIAAKFCPKVFESEVIKL